MKPRIIFSILVTLLTALAPVARAESLDYKEWGMLAIQAGGRRKPVDTFAKESLLRISGRTSYSNSSQTWNANDFLLSILFKTHDWEREPLILVDYKPLVHSLGLDADRKRFSFEELAAHGTQLESFVQQLGNLRKQKKEPDHQLKEVENVV